MKTIKTFLLASLFMTIFSSQASFQNSASKEQHQNLLKDALNEYSFSSWLFGLSDRQIKDKYCHDKLNEFVSCIQPQKPYPHALQPQGPFPKALVRKLTEHRNACQDVITNEIRYFDATLKNRTNLKPQSTLQRLELHELTQAAEKEYWKAKYFLFIPSHEINRKFCNEIFDDFYFAAKDKPVNPLLLATLLQHRAACERVLTHDLDSYDRHQHILSSAYYKTT